VPWVPESAVLGVSAVVAAAIARRIRRGRARARAGRGDDEVVVDPGPDATALEVLVTPFAEAPVLDWLELANRHLTAALRSEQRAEEAPLIKMVRVGPAGVEFLLDARVDWAPGAFELTDGGRTWLLSPDVDRDALRSAASGELAWLPLLVPVGDDVNGTYLLHLSPGDAVSMEGPDAKAMLRAWTAAVMSWPWSEQVAVSLGSEEAEELAPLFAGQTIPDERGTLLYLGDPADLSEVARSTVAAVTPGPSSGAISVVALSDRAVIEPFGISLRSCALSEEHEGGLQGILDERSLIPVTEGPPTEDGTVIGESVPGEVMAGPVEVRLLTFTPELVGLQGRLPTDKTVRITELVAWIALHGEKGTTSGSMLDHGIAGATATKTIYNMVSAARKALGTDASGSQRLALDAGTGLYRVSAEVTVDVLRFEQMAERGVDATDPERAAALCNAALCLIDDIPIGNGVGRYGWWSSSWESRVGRMAVKCARRLVELVESGSIDIDVARRGIERARYAAAGEEELHRIAMELESWGGNQERVEHEWETACRHAETLEPGSAPSEATEAMLLTIRRRRSEDGRAAAG
jgi:DNA-binding SARP family transcriptional activator